MSNLPDTVQELLLKRDSQHEAVASVLNETLEAIFNHSSFDGFEIIPEAFSIEETNDIWALSFQALSAYEEDGRVHSIDEVFRLHALRNGDVYLGIADDYSNRIATGAVIDINAFDKGFYLTNIHNNEADPDKSVDLAVCEIVEQLATVNDMFGSSYNDFITSVSTPQ